MPYPYQRSLQGWFSGSSVVVLRRQNRSLSDATEVPEINVPRKNERRAGRRTRNSSIIAQVKARMIMQGWLSAYHEDKFPVDLYLA